MTSLHKMREEFTRITGAVEEIKRSAMEADRELTDEEAENVETLLTRAEALSPEIEKAVAQEDKLRNVTELLSRTGTQGTKATPKAAELTAGEYISGYIRSAETGRVDEFKRSTAGFYFNRTVADQYLADNAAVVPEPIVGGLLSLSEDSRPVFDSFSSGPMPAKGSSFIMPYITQHVAVDEQANEGDELASRKMALTEQSVSKRTFGGTLNLSQQNIDWTEPSILDLVLADFADEYLRVTEQEAIDYLQSHTGVTSTYTGTNPVTIAQSLITAAKKVRSMVKRPADTVWVDEGTAATWAGTYNTDQSKSVADIVNDALGNFGVNLKVVRYFEDAATPSTGIWVGASSLVRSFEQRKNFLAVNRPSTLEYEVAYYGYIAFATAGGGINSGAVVKLV
jgi:HK97 family phage major capsid protein